MAKLNENNVNGKFDYTKLPFEERLEYEAKGIRKLINGKTPMSFLKNCTEYSAHKKAIDALDDKKDNLRATSLKDFVLYLIAMRTATGQNANYLISEQEVADKKISLAPYAAPFYDKDGNKFYDLAYVSNVDTIEKDFSNDKLTFEYNKLCQPSVAEEFQKGLDNDKVQKICDNLAKATGVNLKLTKDGAESMFLPSKLSSLKHSVKMAVKGGAFNSLSGNYYLNTQGLNGTDILTKYISQCARMSVSTNYKDFEKEFFKDESYAIDKNSQQLYHDKYKEEYMTTNVQYYLHSICSDLVASEMVKTLSLLTAQERNTLSQAYLLSAAQKINGLGNEVNSWVYMRFVANVVKDSVTRYYSNSNLKVEDIIKINESLSYKRMFNDKSLEDAIFGDYKMPYAGPFTYSTTSDKEIQNDKKGASYGIIDKMVSNEEIKRRQQQRREEELRKQREEEEKEKRRLNKLADEIRIFNNTENGFVDKTEIKDTVKRGYEPSAYGKDSDVYVFNETSNGLEQVGPDAEVTPRPQDKEIDTTGIGETSIKLPQDNGDIKKNKYIDSPFALVSIGLDIDSAKQQLDSILSQSVDYSNFVNNTYKKDSNDAEMQNAFNLNFAGLKSDSQTIDKWLDTVKDMEEYLSNNSSAETNEAGFTMQDIQDLKNDLTNASNEVNGIIASYDNISHGTTTSKEETKEEEKKVDPNKKTEKKVENIQEYNINEETAQAMRYHFNSVDKAIEDYNKEMAEKAEQEEKVGEAVRAHFASVDKAIEDYNREMAEKAKQEEKVGEAVRAHFASVDKAIEDQRVADAVKSHFESVDKEIEDAKVADAVKAHFESVDKEIKDHELGEKLKAHFDSVDKTIEDYNKEMAEKAKQEKKVGEAVRAHFASVDKAIEDQRVADAVKSHIESVDKEIEDAKVADAVKAHFESVDKEIKDHELGEKLKAHFDSVDKTIEDYNKEMAEKAEQEEKVGEAVRAHFASVDKAIEDQRVADAVKAHFESVEKEIFEPEVYEVEFGPIELSQEEKQQNKQVQKTLDDFLSKPKAIVKVVINIKPAVPTRELSASKSLFGNKSQEQIRADIEKYLTKYTSKALAEKSLQDKKAVSAVKVDNKFAFEKAQIISGVQASVESVFNNSVSKDKQISSSAINVIHNSINSKNDIERIEGETTNALRALINNETTDILNVYNAMVNNPNASEQELDILDRWQKCRTTASFVNFYANVVTRQVEVAKETIANRENENISSVIGDNIGADKNIKYGVCLKNKVKQITRVASGRISIIENLKSKDGNEFFGLGDGRYVQKYSKGDKHDTNCYKIYECVGKNTNDAKIIEQKVFTEHELCDEQNTENLRQLLNRDNISKAVNSFGGYIGRIVDAQLVVDPNKSQKFEKELNKE